MPQSERQSLLATPLWPFKNLETRREADGSLSFNRQGIEHICQLNRIPHGIFLELPHGSPEAVSSKARAWIREWNALTSHAHWQLEPGEYGTNQEILVFHWYLVYRLYGCVPDFGYESAFPQRVRGVGSEAAGLHMYLLNEAPTHHVAGRQKVEGAATHPIIPVNQ